MTFFRFVIRRKNPKRFKKKKNVIVMIILHFTNKLNINNYTITIKYSFFKQFFPFQ